MRMKTCKWCGRTFIPKKREMFCSVKCAKDDNDLYIQKKQCRKCKYALTVNGNRAYELLCGYLLITNTRRDCDINPCEKFERRWTNEDRNS